MTTFLRLLTEKDKAEALLATCTRWRLGEDEARCFEVAPSAFDAVPGKPFAYWVSEAVRETFTRLPAFESEGRSVKIGMKTGDDFRFLRLWWEITVGHIPYAKGGATEAFYSDIATSVNWKYDGREVKQFVAKRMSQMFGNENYEFWISNESFYGLPGITWSLRAAKFSPRALPAQSIFSVRGYSAFVPQGHELSSLSLMNSAAFDYIFKSALGRFGFPEFIVGILQKLPWAIGKDDRYLKLQTLALRAWSLKRTLDTIYETSHAFLVPAALRLAHPERLGKFDPAAIAAELAEIQAEIDQIAFDLYGFAAADRQAASHTGSYQEETQEVDADDEDLEASDTPILAIDPLLSWAVGVAFGRFDWRLASGERTAPPEPDPFDPLPAKSPGMLPDGAAPFHSHAGILVDDPGHPHDLPHLIEEVVPRLALQRDFFAFHLQRYSKSRRKAPIYWPLATASGSYTLWIYYPSISSQTLFTAINDFVEPKLKEVGAGGTALRSSARSREEEKQFETLQTFELELIELRDTLLKIAQGYQPNHDDGVQITAAPLWSLFRHKPWQKVLKDTWAKLERGDYDWAHLTMNYWPHRVREKCKADKSLAIAHDLEALYVEPEAKPKKTRGKKKSGDNV